MYWPIHSQFINYTGSELQPNRFKRCIEHLWCQSGFIQLLYRYAAIALSYPTVHTSVQSIKKWLYVRTSTVQDANSNQMNRISALNIGDINSDSYRDAQAYSDASMLSHTKCMDPYIANSKYLKLAIRPYINYTGSKCPQINQISG